MSETEWKERIVVRSGNIVIKKAMTNIGEEAITITNLDGGDIEGNPESIMLFEYDWDCLMDAIEKMRSKMGEWKHE